MQVLKEEIRAKILMAAEDMFYQKDYRSAKLTEIASLAAIPVALIYSYFKNKETLFDAVIGNIPEYFIKVLEKEEALEGSPSERFHKAGEEYVGNLLKNHRKFVILMDKSLGTKHANKKHEVILRLQIHIEKGLKDYSKKEYDSMLTHILANNYMENLLEIARHYKNDVWAQSMLQIINQCYYKGVESL